MEPFRFAVEKSFKFDAGHHLDDYVGKCAVSHGHTWTLTVKIYSNHRNLNGMVIDFNQLSAAVKPILDKLDHSYLNYSVDLHYYTCEYLAEWIGRQLIKARIFLSLPWAMDIILQEGEGGKAYAYFQS